ncbi:hypothetical protein LCGC14_0863850 [marine sediment metagenome]|uniref:Uncharacterized protein n=1 Tax=marine sediment metagenome TaxID=412755 RepID=A0A0F9RR78_9ZZZZ
MAQAECEITLFLTMEEARILLAILGRVRGCSSGPRGVADSIGEAIEALAVAPADGACGEIEFESNAT